MKRRSNAAEGAGMLISTRAQVMIDFEMMIQNKEIATVWSDQNNLLRCKDNERLCHAKPTRAVIVIIVLSR